MPLAVLLASLSLLPSEDFLVSRPSTPTTLTKDGTSTLLLSNGLISRRFATAPNFATVSLRSEVSFDTGGVVEVIRGVGPEARITLSCGVGHRRGLLAYAAGALEGRTDPNVTGSSHGSAGIAIGGLRGQQRYAIYEEGQWNWTAGLDDFAYVSHETAQPKAAWAWTPGQRHSSMAAWPPLGLQLRVLFAPPKGRCGCYCDVRVTVVYEMHDGLPTMSKWVEVSNGGGEQLLVESLVTEELHVAEDAKARLHVETDYMPRKTSWQYADGGPASDPGVGQYAGYRMNYPTWWTDPDYEDDVHDQSLHADRARNALLLQLQYPLGPWQLLPPLGEPYKFMTMYLTICDTTETERKWLTRRRVVRTLFPQVTESLLYFYSTNATSAGVRRVAAQAAAVGFEAMLLSFGSGFDPSSTNQTYIARVAADTAYAKSLGIEMGGYTLMQNPKNLTGEDTCHSPDARAGPVATHIADFSTAFHRRYRDNIVDFLRRTGMSMLETDGPYEGATCAVTGASGFLHANNSQLTQYTANVAFYRQLKRELNTFLTVPDPYWNSGGTNREPAGYTDAWNRQIPQTERGTLEYLQTARMYLYDSTLFKPTTEGWLGFEMSRTPPPLDQHLSTLEEALASLLGQGNVPTYRGPEMYDDDSPQAKRLWTLWVAHYKSYRSILSSDVIHISRPTGRGIEAALHVNASVGAAGEPIAFLNLFNPTAAPRVATLRLPLYYAAALPASRLDVRWGGSLLDPAKWPVPPPSSAIVLADYSVPIEVTLAPHSFLWAALSNQGAGGK
jgi:hypothetical protein